MYGYDSCSRAIGYLENVHFPSDQYINRLSAICSNNKAHSSSSSEICKYFIQYYERKDKTASFRTGATISIHGRKYIAEVHDQKTLLPVAFFAEKYGKRNVSHSN